MIWQRKPAAGSKTTNIQQNKPYKNIIQRQSTARKSYLLCFVFTIVADKKYVDILQ